MKTLLIAGFLVLGAVGFSVVAPSSVHAEPRGMARGVTDDPLFVTNFSPDRNQEALPDLSNPGLNNTIVLWFSASLSAVGIVDDQGGLGVKCSLRDQTLAAVPATADVFHSRLVINPFSRSQQVLPQGRYTLTLSPSIRSLGGRRLNGGARPFTLTFFVGDQSAYAPNLLKVSPAAGRPRVALRQAIMATFDEPIALESALNAIRLEDRSTVPPTPIPTRIRLARRGFAVVVTPAVRTRYPRGADVALVIAGEGSATDPSAPVLTEVEGHKFTRDRGPSWSVDPLEPTLFHSVNGDFDDVTGEFTLAFRTRGVAASR